MVQKVNFNVLTGDSLTIGNTVIDGTGVTVNDEPLSGGTGGAQVYANSSQFPLTDLTPGSFAFANNNNTLYLTNGSGWYKIALINQTPSITLSLESVELGVTGNTADITYTISEPEGTPTTVSVSNSGIANTSMANVQLFTSNNTIRINNFANADNTFTATVTATVSDGVNIGTDSVSVAVVYITYIENSKYTTALITSSGTAGDNDNFTDASSNNHTITNNSSAQYSTFSPYREAGYSVAMRGNAGNMLRFNHTALGTGDWTIETWVYFKDVSSQQYIFDFRTSGDTKPALNIDPSGAGGTNQGWQYISDASYRIQSGTDPVAHQWYHVAIVKNSGTTTLYVDGTSLGTYSDSLNYTGNSAAKIGNYSLSNAYGFDGFMYNFRVVSGTAVYTSNFTPPTEPLEDITNTQLLACALPYYADASSNDLAVTPYGAARIHPFTPFDYEPYDETQNGGSIDFNHSISNGIDVPGTNLILSGDFTIEGWVYDLATNDDREVIFELGTYQNGVLFRFGSTTYDSLYINNSNVASPESLGFDVWAWNHFALVRNSGNITLYCNGKSVFTQSNSSTLNSTGANLRIGAGRHSGAGVQIWNGNIADFRVFNGTAVYTADFTPPTSPLPSTNSTLHITGKGANVIDKSQTAKAIELNGDIVTTNTAISFSGSTPSANFVAIYGLSDALTWGTGDWTFEFFADLVDSGSAYQKIWDGRNTGSGFIVQVDRTGGHYEVFDQSVTQIITGTTNVLGAGEKHVAISRSNGTTRLFVDGTQEGSSVSDSSNYTATSTNWNLWDAAAVVMSQQSTSTSTGHIEGTIRDLRITKGLARYTSNFTAPTSLEG